MLQAEHGRNDWTWKERPAIPTKQVMMAAFLLVATTGRLVTFDNSKPRYSVNGSIINA